MVDLRTLREKVVEASALALAETEMLRDGHPGIGLQQIFPMLPIDYDLLIAASLVHDVGKAFEVCPRNVAF